MASRATTGSWASVAGRPRDCVVFLTHFWSPRLAAHYGRLQREAGAGLDVVLACHAGEGAVPAGMEPDVVVGDAAIAAAFPLRQAQMGGGPPGGTGHVDVIWLTAFLDPLLARYDRLWVMEYDVDFSGDWSSFFGAMAGVEADLLATWLRPRSEDPDWPHWRSHRQPPDGPPDPLAGFMPLARLSRPLLKDLWATLQTPEWAGHFESVLPTVALAHGFRIEEIGGGGRWTPPPRRGQFYASGPSARAAADRTFEFRPPKGYRFYVERPRAFRRSGRLFHPIKVNAGFRSRLRDYRLRLRRLFPGGR